MIWLFGFALLVMALMNFCVCKSVLFPPFVFCASWSMVIFGLEAVKDIYYPVTSRTLWIYVAGAIAFSAGGFIAALLKLPGSKVETGGETPHYINILLTGTLIAALLLLPLYWQYLMELTGGISGNFWKQLRTATLERENSDEPMSAPLNLTVSLIPVFSILAMVGVYEFCRSGKQLLRTAALVITALLYQLGSTARSQVLTLLLGLFSCIWFRYPRRAMKWGAIGAVAFALLFGVNQISMEKVGARADAPLVENIPKVVEGLALYSEGSLVAFETAVRNPGLIPNNSKLYRYFIRTLNRLGMNIEQPTAFLPFTPISNEVTVNVYTIYFAYYMEYGLLGTMILMAGLGLITTYIFRKASTNDPQNVLLFGSALYGILMTFFAEEFFLELGFWLKTIILSLLIYRVAPKLFSAKTGTLIAETAS
jgi:oligosaccharide repeat unit polymerase